MIISVSYKTDIPTFYGEWFMNRLQAGYCKMINPYNLQVSRVELTPEHVDGFVFWTKNIGPFLKRLPEVHKRGYPFIVQHTINGYPSQLENKVIKPLVSIEHMKTLADIYGPRVAIWRYDPLIISSLTSLDWHRRNFEQLAIALQGTIDEVVVSYAQLYKKTKRNMDQASKAFGFDWDEHEHSTNECISAFIVELALMAKSYGMQLKICSQKIFCVPNIVEEARCIDAARLEMIAHKPLHGKVKQRGNRKECGCFASKDIGEYDTCPHGCIYCYAVQRRELAVQRYKSHDPESEFLFSPKNHVSSIANNNTTFSCTLPMAVVKKKEDQDTLVQRKLFE